MTVKQLLSNKRFRYWVNLEYGYSDLSVDTDFELLEHLMSEWLATPKCLEFAKDVDRKDSKLTCS